MDRILDIVKQCGASGAACIKYSDCDIINHRLADKLDFVPKSVIIATVPYYTEYCDKARTVSAYALAHDYHIYLKMIAEAAIEKAKMIFPTAAFQFFGDHSPINEKTAAAKAGLGIIGQHSLLITKEHSSFVFIFEIFTDIDCNIYPQEIMQCSKCNKCIEACPGFLRGTGRCLSEITQKKGALEEDEIILISENGYSWGCDICQLVCPYTQAAISDGSIYTQSTWFNSDICCVPSEATLSNLSDFKKRAYSWRGKDTILRNIKILNGGKND